MSKTSFVCVAFSMLMISACVFDSAQGNETYTEEYRIRKHCESVVPPDTILRFGELYASGNVDTIMIDKNYIREFSIDSVHNTFFIEEILPWAYAPLNLGFFFYEDTFYSSNLCKRQIVTDLNIGESPIINLVKTPFADSILNQLQNQLQVFENPECGYFGITNHFHITAIEEFPAMQPADYKDTFSCNDSTIERKTPNVTATYSIAEDPYRIHPDPNFLNPYNEKPANPFYLDVGKLPPAESAFQWSMTLEDAYGFDTTIVLQSVVRYNLPDSNTH